MSDRRMYLTSIRVHRSPQLPSWGGRGLVPAEDSRLRRDRDAALLLHYCFFSLFLRPHLQHVAVTGLGVKSELQLRPTPQPRQRQTQAASATCTAARCHTG